MGQVKNNDSFLGKAEKLKPVLKHRMLRPVGVVSFERKKADSGADFWNTNKIPVFLYFFSLKN